MTRYTNVARKRTYVQAGFEPPDGSLEISTPQLNSRASDAITIPGAQEDNQMPQEPKKKRRRRGKSKPEGNPETSPSIQPTKTGDYPEQIEETTTKTDGRSLKKSRTYQERQLKGFDARKAASERRRLKRQDLRHADTICYACRQQGHAARDCTATLSVAESTAKGRNPKINKGPSNGVGICYRCGSKRHNLSRCPALVDADNPLPFASCFVCSEKGHLASTCPKNQSKGIYPNGGCCKLCGKTSHLAKDCDLRKSEVVSNTLLFGTGREAGADEDDFHTFKRKTAELNMEDKGEERRKRLRDLKVGSHSGVVKAFGNPVTPKANVVTF